MILDLGCGTSPLNVKNVITVDYDFRFKPRILYDLSKTPFPFKDNIFDFINCNQIVEHLPNTVDTIGEILRIGKVGCKVFISVPHYSSSISYSDPTHVRQFSIRTMNPFCENYFQYEHNKCFEMLSRKIIYSKIWKYLGLSKLFNILQRPWEDKLCGIFPAKFIEWEFVIKKANQRGKIAS